MINELRRAGTDNTRIEVKSGGRGVGKSLLPTISAFSNTAGGGSVIIGLDEKSGFAPVDGFNARAVMDQLAELARPRGANEEPGLLSPRPRMTFERQELDGAAVVVVDVAELPAAEKPCFVTSQGKERGTFVRVGEGDHRLDTYEVFQLSTLTVPSAADREPVRGAAMDDLDNSVVSRTIQRMQTNRPRALAGADSQSEVLERIGVIDRDTGLPTLAGVLAMGRFPQQFFPQLMISFAAYPGRDKEAVVGDDRMVDRAVLEGAIPDMVDDAVRAVVRNLRVRRVSRGVGAEDVPEIPIAAIREAIVNAVMHRDYSDLARGDQVRVELYPDRLEVHSPGVLWGGQTIESIHRGSSRSRNQVLARLLTDVPFTDRDETVGENAGYGIPRMQGEMTRNGLPSPRFRTTWASFVTELDRFGLMNPETRDWLDGLGGGRRTDMQDHALAVLHHLDSVTVDELRRQLAVDTTVAQTALDQLSASGLVQGDHGVYRLEVSENRSDLTPAEKRVIDALGTGETMSAREISVATGASVSALRPVLRALINAGRIEPTAPPTSRNRAYRLSE
ncbi:transcriptional regulator [Gordonia neofelifaecis NRRL B-59395]|uniref:Transcriptional regulator n=1 Tax=Gordonia neofelifaecis NRRL B-59395 TaxID=644548 RepID=F1YL36_9ACTN|nr:transcriptional regulator [Gordonia neofelifaecis NRRL B-59395]